MTEENKLYWWTSSSGRIEFQLPKEAIEQCHHSGPCDSDVEHWQPILDLNLDRAVMIQELLEYGAWSTEELNDLTNEELEHKFIWIASGDIQDSEEWNHD